MKFECRFLKRMVWCIIIPSRGKAYTLSCAVRSAPFESSPGNDVTQRPYSYPVKMASRAGLCADFGEENGVGGYNTNRTLRLGVPSALLMTIRSFQVYSRADYVRTRVDLGGANGH